MILVGQAGATGIDVALHQFHVFEIVGDDGAAFARSDQFAGLKTEGAQIAHRAGALALPHSSVSVGAIFNDFQIVFLGDVQNFVHVGEAHSEMNGQNRLGFGSDCLFDEFRIEAIGVGIDVDEDRNCIEQQHRPDGAFPGVGRNNDFIAGTNPNGI